MARFEQICRDHVERGRAKAFAIIFFDFLSLDVMRILRNQTAFGKLDRLSGKELSIFFVHSGSTEFVRKFNDEFVRRLGVEEVVEIPCVVFFKLDDEGFRDVSVAVLDNPDLINGFSELEEIIERYINNDVEGFKLKA